MVAKTNTTQKLNCIKPTNILMRPDTAPYTIQNDTQRSMVCGMKTLIKELTYLPISMSFFNLLSLHCSSFINKKLL